jgi:plastocyanin
MVRVTRGIWFAAELAMVATLAACSGDTAGSGPNTAALTIEEAGSTGNGQTGTVRGDLPAPMRIVVVRGGTPAAGAVVRWSASGTGAFMTPSLDTTGVDGISTSTWHLGSELGLQTSQATVVGGAAGSLVSFTATALAPSGDPGGAANAVTIQLRSGGGNRFEPANVTIPVGTKVTWVWVDGFHNVEHEVLSGSDRNLVSSGAPVFPPSGYSFTFTAPGTYDFFCTVHGTLTTGMHGTIVVQ